MDKQFDVVVIGSGFGGLMCAALLGKHGYRVCVLEKHELPGGNLQNFVRGGKVFNTGLHYIGALDKGQALYKIFKYLGIMDRVAFDRLNPRCFDHILFGDKSFCNVSGFEGYQNALISYFPEEKTAIETYVARIREVWDRNPILNFREAGLSEEYPRAFINEGLMDVMDSITANEDLKALLLSNNGLYAGVPGRTPFYVHALINCLFIQSAFNVRGGSANLARALVDIIRAQDGVVWTGKKVVKITTENNKARSVVTETGEVIRGECFYAAIHPAEAIKLFEEGVFRKPFVKRINNLPNTIGSFVLYVAFKEKTFKHLNCNVYYSRTRDVWGAVYTSETWPKSVMLYTTYDKDDPEYAESATVITFMDYSEVARWEDPVVRKKDDSYETFRTEKSRLVMEMVELKFPGFTGAIDSWFASTPLTYRDYTGIPEGSMYGIAKDYRNGIGSYMPTATRVPNFYLTGQSIGIHGIMGVAMNAILASANKLDMNTLLKEIGQVE
ncbi:MAG: NAD(P)/FAD-dependent oxidoreductase [Breznakibacter sp.]